MSKTTVVNCFSGPSSGKSTLSAGLFYRLKCLRANVEYATEAAKDFTHDERHKALQDQLYVFSKQQQRVRRLVPHYEVIVTDSPVLMGLVYAQGYPECFRQTVLWNFNQQHNLNFFVNRDAPYDPIGRNQTEEQARDKDTEIRDLLAEFSIPYYEVTGSEDGLEEALKVVRQHLSI